MPKKQSTTNTDIQPDLLTKQELASALNLPSTSMVDQLVAKKMIPVLRLGHKTVRFSHTRVLQALEKFEIRAVS